MAEIIQRTMVRSVLPFAATFVLLLLGCEEEKIQTYRAPKDPPKARPPAPVSGMRRMVNAILIHPDGVWYFKLDGAASEVEAERQRFMEFLTTVKLDGKKASWKLPEGWSEAPSSPNRYATIHVRRLELSVTVLGPESAPLLPNVNRWRGQMGLPPVQESDLSRFVSHVTTPSGTAVVVDLVSSEAPPPAPAGKELNYSVPTGWTEQPAGEMRKAAFKIEKGADTAVVTVIPLRGMSGTLIDNVNRWRQQVELPPATESEVQLAMRKIQVGGYSAPYFDLPGPSVRILIALVQRGDNTWYFKLTGPVALVEEHKSAFEEFLRSVKFNE